MSAVSTSQAIGKPGTRSPHILVVDDDPIFRAKVRSAAVRRRLSVTTCSSFEEVKVMIQGSMFDSVVVDYFLDDLHKHLRGTDVACLTGDTPVILVSHSSEAMEEEKDMPESIRHTMNKEAGIDAILDVALLEAKMAGSAD